VDTEPHSREDADARDAEAADDARNVIAESADGRARAEVKARNEATALEMPEGFPVLSRTRRQSAGE
jgi:hypothetical protein